MLREEVLNKISESSIYGNLGLFIGAGMTKAIINDYPLNYAKGWKELLYDVANNFKINFEEEFKDSNLSLPEIASKIVLLIRNIERCEYKEALNKLKNKIADITAWYPEEKIRNDFGETLDKINPDWIITSNYDLVLECLLPGRCESLAPDNLIISRKELIPIYHLHGIRTIPDSIIITQEDYISLFRPNQYRLQKLPLLIKESTTLLIGYGLGDINVLTAVDWSKNVYNSQNGSNPHNIIQLLFKNKPQEAPYIDNNGIIILEISSILDTLNEIKENIDKKRKIYLEESTVINEYIEMFKNANQKDVSDFINKEEWRILILKFLSENEMKYISGFLVYFTKVMDQAWEETIPNQAWEAYDNLLRIILDIIEKIELNKLPPALFESIVSNFSRLSNFIGNNLGQSIYAYRTWNKRKNNINQYYINEIINISKARYYDKLHILFSMLKVENQK